MSQWQTKFSGTAYGSVYYATSGDKPFVPQKLDGPLVPVKTLYHESADGNLREGDSQTKYQIPIQILFNSSRWTHQKSASIAIYDGTQRDDGTLTSTRTIVGASFKNIETHKTANVFASNYPHTGKGAPQFSGTTGTEAQINGWYDKITGVIGNSPDQIIFMSDTNLYNFNSADAKPMASVPTKMKATGSTDTLLEHLKTCCTGESPRWKFLYDVIAYAGFGSTTVAGGYALTKELMNDDSTLQGDHPHMPIYLTVKIA